tara:strand:- start:253 stop:477 length:225 start_codon:yes stop_codon:yes gene_type:complete
MKSYNFTQVKRALENKGFSATKSFSSDTEYTTIFEKSSDVQYSFEIANVEEWIENGVCTIDGLCPSKWGQQQFN